MKLEINETGFTVWLSRRDTYDWSESWPCSELSDNRMVAEFDAGGLVGLTVNGGYGCDVPGDELTAIVSDYVYSRLPEDHPCLSYLESPDDTL